MGWLTRRGYYGIGFAVMDVGRLRMTRQNPKKCPVQTPVARMVATDVWRVMKF
jgi:hypothetical protein